jgi:glycosyltransferase involved in cell wall biosynthesis
MEPHRLHVIHNWANGRAIAPMNAAGSPLRRAWALEGKFVVAYSGNLGRVHEFGTLLDAAARLRSHADIQFVVIGRGPRLAEVEARVDRKRLGNVRFEPHQDRALLSESLGLADVHLSILRPEFEGLVQPSKLYGIMAAGRPAIFVGRVTGETARILAETSSGLSVATGDGAGLAAAILRLRDDPPERLAMGSRARTAFEVRYDMPIAMAKWASLLAA